MDASAYLEGSIKVSSPEDVDLLLARVTASATQVRQWINAFTGEPLEFLRRLKFEAVGYHPIGHHPLNIIEQVNQTWTYATALLAARQLFALHPEAGGYHLAPGAHASQPLDIMSEVEGLVGAETFAAVTPRNNHCQRLIEVDEPSRGPSVRVLYVTTLSWQPPPTAVREGRSASLVRRLLIAGLPCMASPGYRGGTPISVYLIWAQKFLQQTFRL
ncbi:hypothetical protein GGE07_000527 [Sinorhizobium terangae]|uniref:Uncharacterized protein n=1 Tax=Sinorhizobium terangae TaxID=110322 RepID=A0A6N7LBE5_SINTE|nr:hypothetical protein [Sinorhizobium terangae]MBB4183914.1 hypothetical protein [Sinorhizobium terangae]MQX15062.1 hypothetical protein [Sinorhizobium terangae]